MRFAASAGPSNGKGKATPAAVSNFHTGIRSLKIGSGGQLLLNGKAVHFRGVALHEDTLTQGAAVDNATRARIVALAQNAGTTLIRSHYPLHPEFQELADRKGLLLWSEIPAMYQLPEDDLARTRFRALAFQELQANVIENRNHPSVTVWSVGNEMPAQVRAGQAAYIRDAAKLARKLDPTRLIGVAYAGHPENDCQTGYAPLDVIGMNDYFGWYTGTGGNIADRDGLSPYLDQLHKCYPAKAVAVTEYGAEANRDGPVEEKGSYAFQSDFIQFQATVFNSKPWLAGSVYWALQEFRVRPGWGGGNPWGTPPLPHEGPRSARLDREARLRDPACARPRRAPVRLGASAQRCAGTRRGSGAGACAGRRSTCGSRSASRRPSRRRTRAGSASGNGRPPGRGPRGAIGAGRSLPPPPSSSSSCCDAGRGSGSSCRNGSSSSTANPSPSRCSPPSSATSNVSSAMGGA